MSELLNFILDHEPPFKSQTRLASLYSDFLPLKTTNPDGYHANISVWTSALVHASRAGVMPGSGMLSIKTGNGLMSDLGTKRWGRPLALEAVFDEALANKVMIPLQEFLDTKTSIYEKRWINIQVPTPWQIAKWGLRQIGLQRQNRLADGDFVVLSNIEEAAKEVLAIQSACSPTPTSLIYSLSTFTSTFAHILSPIHTLSSTDISILLQYLSRDKRVASVQTSEMNGSTTIKFAPSSSPGAPSPITAHEITIATLNTLSSSLTAQIAVLTARITALQASTRTHLENQNRTLAISHLRQKKQAEATLAKRVAALDQVTTVLLSIDEAAGQVEMVAAMKESSQVLRELNKQVGGVERVGKILDGLRDEMESVEEVGRVIADGESVDEDEVDEEMAMLEREEREKRKAAEKTKDRTGQERTKQEVDALATLPDVPEGLPNSKGNGIETDQSEVDGTKAAEADVEKRLSLMSIDESPRQKSAALEV